jgi:hypothetical protein
LKYMRVPGDSPARALREFCLAGRVLHILLVISGRVLEVAQSPFSLTFDRAQYPFTFGVIVGGGIVTEAPNVVNRHGDGAPQAIPGAALVRPAGLLSGAE